MRTPREYLDALRARLAIRTDKQLAARLGVSPALVCRWRNGSMPISEAHCDRVARALGISALNLRVAMAEYRLANGLYERGKAPGSRRWREWGNKTLGLFPAAILAGALVASFFFPDKALARIRPGVVNTHSAKSPERRPSDSYHFLMLWSYLGPTTRKWSPYTVATYPEHAFLKKWERVPQARLGAGINAVPGCF